MTDRTQRAEPATSIYTTVPGSQQVHIISQYFYPCAFRLISEAANGDQTKIMPAYPSQSLLFVVDHGSPQHHLQV